MNIAILIPCYNEEKTIADVVTSFRQQLPEAEIFVFDNASTDGTAELARAAGAIVYREPRRGKGFVVQSMFRRIKTDVFVMVDGDGTYPASEVRRLIEPILHDEADMVVGSRLHAQTKSEFKQLNRWANRLVLAILNSIFRVKLTDILSGYRAFNRKFVKSLPVFGGGFEIETELTIKAIARGFRIVEIPTPLTARPEGSHSKIKFFRDGFLIINTILALFRDYKPLTFFGLPAVFLLVLGIIPGLVVLFEILQRQSTQRPLLAVLSVGLVLCGLLLLAVGLILHSIARRSQEFEYQVQVMIDEVRDAVRQSK
ncbi:MAG TPA: glycosyltransferase [Pyrinomonadaceae bacterium]|nr:glycosyltransferase [Pyrinomonadaceae bacterium]